jgi:hypothetical protein
MFKNLTDCQLRKAIRMTEADVQVQTGIDRDAAASRLYHLLFELVLRNREEGEA